MITPAFLEVLARASNEAYDVLPGQDHVPETDLEIIKLLTEVDGTIRGFVAHHPEGNVIAIKGTASYHDLLIDCEFPKKPFRGTRVSEGFLSEHDQVLPQLPMNELRCGLPIFATGHSMGGAVASLLGLSLPTDHPELEVSVGTFGCPYTGDPDFAGAFNRRVKESIRVVHDDDLVPRLNSLGSKHVDGLLHLDDEGKEVGITSGVLIQIAHWIKLARKDLTGVSVGDHHQAFYVNAVTKRAERQAAKEKAKAG